MIFFSHAVAKCVPRVEINMNTSESLFTILCKNLIVQLELLVYYCYHTNLFFGRRTGLRN